MRVSTPPRLAAAIAVVATVLVAQSRPERVVVKPTPAVDDAAKSPAPAAIATFAAAGTPAPASYILAPDDSIVIHATDMEEISEHPIRIDPQGNLRLPLLGRVHAAGLNLDQLEGELAKRLGEFVNEPHVSVSIAGYRSQPISILGAVMQPGVQQLEGDKTLFEVLSRAGGLRPDAGYRIRITRRTDQGKLPLPDASMDPSGEFSVGSVGVKSILDATNPTDNIVVKPNDVITVPKGELVFVIGSVKKAGGFVLNDKANVSVLTALSFAEGLDSRAAPARARIMRQEPGNAARTEIPVDLKKILEGKAPDQALTPNDILFVPINVPRNAAIRGLESALQIGTQLAIYRP